MGSCCSAPTTAADKRNAKQVSAKAEFVRQRRRISEDSNPTADATPNGEEFTGVMGASIPPPSLHNPLKHSGDKNLHEPLRIGLGPHNDDQSLNDFKPLSIQDHSGNIDPTENHVKGIKLVRSKTSKMIEDGKNRHDVFERHPSPHGSKNSQVIPPSKYPLSDRPEVLKDGSVAAAAQTKDGLCIHSNPPLAAFSISGGGMPFPNQLRRFSCPSGSASPSGSGSGPGVAGTQHSAAIMRAVHGTKMAEFSLDSQAQCASCGEESIATEVDSCHNTHADLSGAVDCTRPLKALQIDIIKPPAVPVASSYYYASNDAKVHLSCSPSDAALHGDGEKHMTPQSLADMLPPSMSEYWATPFGPAACANQQAQMASVGSRPLFELEASTGQAPMVLLMKSGSSVPNRPYSTGDDDCSVVGTMSATFQFNKHHSGATTNANSGCYSLLAGESMPVKDIYVGGSATMTSTPTPSPHRTGPGPQGQQLLSAFPEDAPAVILPALPPQHCNGGDISSQSAAGYHSAGFPQHSFVSSSLSDLQIGFLVAPSPVLPKVGSNNDHELSS